MSFSRAMCLVRGDATDSEVIETVSNISAGNNRQIRFVHVIVVDRKFELDTVDPVRYAKAERILRSAEHASGLRNETRGAVLQARSIGPVLVREALEFRADVIVMATQIAASLNSKKIDADSEYLMSNAPCAVVLVRGSEQEFEATFDRPNWHVEDVAPLRR